MVACVWWVGVGVVGFLVVPGLVVRRGREFSPAGSTRNPLRRPATFPGWEGACRVCGGFSRRLGVCAATLDAGLSRPSSTNPHTPAPRCQRNGDPKANPLWGFIAANACGVCVVVRSCDGQRPTLRAGGSGPGTPGGALRPGPAGVCALR